MSSLISSDKIEAKHFHSTSGKYPKEFELKDEHQGDHVTFLNLDITIKNGILCTSYLIKDIPFHFQL